MNPLMPAPQPALPPVPATQGPLPTARGGLPQATGEDSFALVLEQGQAALLQAAVPVVAGMPASQALLEDIQLELDPEVDAAALGLGMFAFQPPPPWPPPGLAGLALSPAATPATGPALAGVAGAGAAAPAALAIATLADAGAEAGTEALAAQLLAGADAGGEGDAAAEAPAPGFALPPLPSATPVREAAPMLAAPGPTPDVRAQDFSERFGAQLQWMAGQQIGSARIRVSPQELGPVEVVLRLDGERISADFISSHPETRQALEQGLPRLRDLLGEHGFQLAHADVGHQSSSPDDGEPAPGGGTGTGAGGPAGPGDQEPAPMRTLRGLVDAFA